MLQRLTENWLLKLVSLGFALVLWFFIMGERRLEVGFAVPLELKQVPEGMMVANEVPTLVDVRLSGPRTLLMNLGPKDISISVDLSDLKPGVASFRRLDDKLKIPTGVKVTRLSPSFVDVKLERIVTKSVPVRAVLSGRPGPGVRIAAIAVEPSQVQVEGAEGELQELSEVLTDAIGIDGLSSDQSLTVPINYRGKYAQLKHDHSVEVRIKVETATGPRKKPRR